MTPARDVLLIGGGVGGLAAAIALERVGIPAHVFEQASALREVGAGVSLWPNGMRALATLGLFQSVLADHIPIERIVILRRDGRLLLRLDEPGRAREPSICVHRAHLQQTLARAVAPDRLHLDRRLVDCEAREGGVTAAFHDGSTARGVLLIGCDGIDSRVSARLHGAAAPAYRGYEIWRGVSDFELPSHLARQSTEWWAPGSRFGILPGEPGRVYWYATRSTGARRRVGHGDHSGHASDDAGDRAIGHAAEHAADRRRLEALFAPWPGPVPELLAATPAGDIVRTDAEDGSVPRRWGRGRMTLLGDAAHAMTPNMGQGACTALEDAVALAECLARLGPVPDALRRYERLRRPRTRWIVRRSRQIGRLAQLTNPLLVGLRDWLLPHVPEAITRPAQRRVYGYGAA